LKGQVLLGNEAFIEVLRPFLNDIDKVDEIPRTQRAINRPSLSSIFKKPMRSPKRNATKKSEKRI